MTQWLYYIISAAAAGIAIYLISHLSYEGTQTSVNATNFQRVKDRQFAMIQTIERDFRNMGATKMDLTGVIQQIDTTCTGSGWCKYRFWTRMDTDTSLADPSKGLVASENQDSVRVQYRWRYAFPNSMQIPDRDSYARDATKSVTTLQFERRLYPNPQDNKVRLDSVFTEFKITAYDATGARTYDVALARQFRIEIEALTPRSIGKDAIEISRWETFIRPVNLTRLDQEIE